MELDSKSKFFSDFSLQGGEGVFSEIFLGLEVLSFS